MKGKKGEDNHPADCGRPPLQGGELGKQCRNSPPWRGVSEADGVVLPPVGGTLGFHAFDVALRGRLSIHAEIIIDAGGHTGPPLLDKPSIKC